MKAIIIDDEANSRELLQNMLSLFCSNVEVIGTAESVQTGYTLLQKERPDVLFLDVQMGDGTGFDLLSMLETASFHVIFTTAYQEYAIRAFQFSAVDYLLKPLSPEYLIKAVNKVQKLNQFSDEVQALIQNIKQPENQKIVVKTHDRIYSLPVKEIVRCESDSSYSTVFLESGYKIVVAKQLKEFDEMLSPMGFMRIHQSHLVNPDFVFYFQKGANQLIMKDQTSIPVSTKKKDDVLTFIAANNLKTK